MITFNELGKYGRFGNQLFQVASTIGIAVKNGYSYGFPEWKESGVDMREVFKHEFNTAEHMIRGFNIPWGYADIQIPNQSSLHGYLQSEKYFDHCKDLIRHHFEFTDNLKQPQSEFCAIHVRRGDYDGHHHLKIGLDYYFQATALMPAGTQFKLFSDDPKFTSEMFGNKCEDGDWLSDFCTMRSCKHFIISNSTYSWWAAWLGEHPDKKVIAPAQWFGPGLNKIFSMDNLIPETWIKI